MVATLTLLLAVALAMMVMTELLGRGLLDWLLLMPDLVQRFERHGGSELSALGLFAATPFLSALRFLIYINGRTKHDGWDVQIKFMHIEATQGVRRWG